jgi:hypothetical protein
MFIFISKVYADDSQEGAANWDKWIDCASNDDCVPIHDACGGWTSVNLQYKKEGEEYQKKLATQIQCADVKLEPEPKVMCLDQVCTVKPAGLDNGAQ